MQSLRSPSPHVPGAPLPQPGPEGAHLLPRWRRPGLRTSCPAPGRSRRARETEGGERGAGRAGGRATCSHPEQPSMG